MKKTLLAVFMALVVAVGGMNVTACKKTSPSIETPTEQTDPVVSVEEIQLDISSKELTVGDSFTLTATVYPTNATNQAYSWSCDNTNASVSSGVVTAIAAGTATITVTTEDGAKTATCIVTVKEQSTSALSLTYSYAGNECAAFEWADSAPAQATVQYKLSTDSNYTALDEELVRASTSSVARADVLGLKGGANYDFKITSSAGKTVEVTLAITAYDRSGYAHFGYTSGVGAYNDDGTIKSGAQVVYVTEATKNTVQATIGGKTYTGIVNILQNAGTSTPLVVRIIGTVGAATWNEIDYNSSNTYSSSNKISASSIVGANGSQLPTDSSTKQADLISGGYNTLNTTTYTELDNLTSKAKYSSGEYDSYWNMCDISGVSNVTVEGVGEDARIFQWGFTWKNCSSIEVRNLTFEDYTEDACSFEGSDTSATSLSDFTKSKNIWFHHNTVEEGINYWDVCAEQDKHEGDGGTDFKGAAYITLSYNVYHNNHKTGLIGGSDTQTTACVTFHHNYYNACVSRLPLGRQANMHMYNNYYYGTTGTNMSLRAGAYALIENCYFDNANNPIETKATTSDGAVKTSGVAKLCGNIFSGKQYTASSYIHEVDRDETVTNYNAFSQDFDINSSVFYYDSTNKKSSVTVMYTAEETKTYVPQLAGVQKRNGTAYIQPSDSGSSSDSGTTDNTSGEASSTTMPTYATLAAREDKIYANDFSSETDGTKLSALSGYSTAGIYTLLSSSSQSIDSDYAYISGGKVTQSISLNTNISTVIAFGSVSSYVEGRFTISTSDIGTKWNVINFVNSSGKTVFTVRINTDKTTNLVYTLDGGTNCVTPTQSFVWAKDTEYSVYYKIDLSTGKITVYITDGINVFSVSELAASITDIGGIQLISSNKGGRLTTVDNVVFCGK